MLYFSQIHLLPVSIYPVYGSEEGYYPKRLWATDDQHGQGKSLHVAVLSSLVVCTAELPECAEKVTVQTKDLDCLVLRVSWDLMLALWLPILRTVYLSCLYLETSQYFLKLKDFLLLWNPNPSITHKLTDSVKNFISKSSRIHFTIREVFWYRLVQGGAAWDVLFWVESSQAPSQTCVTRA